jgi:translation initiation factor IF-3
MPGSNFRRCLGIATQNEQQQINDAIKDREVRVVGPAGEQLGIMSGFDARRLADGRNLDLVKIAPHAKPPVVKIMDFGKFRFEQSRREKEQRKNQKAQELKEVQLSPRIGKHDLDVKAATAKRLLEDGSKIKVSIRFRGREMAHTDLGYNTMREFAQSLQTLSVVERPAKLDGKQMLMFLAPLAAKPEKVPKPEKTVKPEPPKV